MNKSVTHRVLSAGVIGLLVLGIGLSLAPFALRWGSFGLTLVLISTALSLAVLDIGGFCRPIWWGIGIVAERRWLAVWIVGFVALGIAMFLTWLREPQPSVHDEFSYLLAADTFASGRMANPTHPLWEHFETFHVLSKPTYASRYPPGQGLALAAGEWLIGRPIVGVWLSFALACAATCWMLQAWVPVRWAFVGALLAALHPTLQTGYLIAPQLHKGSWMLVFSVTAYSWSQSFWGGAVAMLGGSLVFGALPRIMRQPLASHAITMGLGVSILANTRPFEGLVVCVPVGIVLLLWMRRSGNSFLTTLLPRFLLPLGATLALLIAGMFTYNRTVTGNPFRMPHVSYSQAYEPCSVFLFFGARPVPKYNHEPLRQFFVDWTLQRFLRQQSLAGWAEAHFPIIWVTTEYFVGPFGVLLLLVPCVWRRREVRFAILTIFLLFVIQQTLYTSFPHYYAPASSLFFLVLAECLRRLYVLRVNGIKVGRYLAIAFLSWVPLYLGMAAHGLVKMAPTMGEQRARIQRTLEETSGRHLVIVRYRPDHNSHQEFVANRADIDGSKVVWAREMDEAKNRRLLDYYRSRHHWLLEADKQPLILVPYQRGASPSDRQGSQPR